MNDMKANNQMKQRKKKGLELKFTDSETFLSEEDPTSLTLLIPTSVFAQLQVISSKTMVLNGCEQESPPMLRLKSSKFHKIVPALEQVFELMMKEYKLILEEHTVMVKEHNILKEELSISQAALGLLDSRLGVMEEVTERIEGEKVLLEKQVGEWKERVGVLSSSTDEALARFREEKLALSSNIRNLVKENKELDVKLAVAVMEKIRTVRLLEDERSKAMQRDIDLVREKGIHERQLNYQLESIKISLDLRMENMTSEHELTMQEREKTILKVETDNAKLKSRCEDFVKKQGKVKKENRMLHIQVKRNVIKIAKLKKESVEDKARNETLLKNVTKLKGNLNKAEESANSANEISKVSSNLSDVVKAENQALKEVIAALRRSYNLLRSTGPGLEESERIGEEQLESTKSYNTK